MKASVFFFINQKHGTVIICVASSGRRVECAIEESTRKGTFINVDNGLGGALS